MLKSEITMANEVGSPQSRFEVPPYLYQNLQEHMKPCHSLQIFLCQNILVKFTFDNMLAIFMSNKGANNTLKVGGCWKKTCFQKESLSWSLRMQSYGDFTTCHALKVYF